MPRSAQSPLSRVLEYFRTTSLEVLAETFPLVQEIISDRRAKSSKAKARATKGPRAAAVATVAEAGPAPVVDDAVAAKKKAARAKYKAKAAAKKKALKVAAQPVAQSLPDVGADTEVVQPDEYEPVGV